MKYDFHPATGKYQLIHAIGSSICRVTTLVSIGAMNLGVDTASMYVKYLPDKTSQEDTVEVDGLERKLHL